MAEEFQYLPLGPRKQCLRILRLLSGNTVEIKCEIVHDYIADDHVTPYEALSYTWGSAELLECISVNDGQLPITDNLYAVLHYLRFPDRDRLLWIDAVCINQADLQERNQQVQMMGLIYSSAERVIFWLGKATAEARLLSGFLAGLHGKSTMSTSDKIVDPTPASQILCSSFRPTLESQSHDLIDKLRTGLQLLLKRPWFRRVWILQEVANAQSAIICAGSSSLPAYLFALAPALLDVQTEPHTQSVLDMMPRADHREPVERRRALLDLLKSFHRSEATDKRDLVYALLGMSSDPHNHRLLRADYNKNIAEVLHDVIRYWFELEVPPVREALDFLSEFDHVCMTFLVPLQRIGGLMAEIELLDMKSTNHFDGSEFSPEMLQSMCAPRHLIVEQCLGETPTGNCCADIHRFMTHKHIGPPEMALSDALRVVHWRSPRHNLKFLVVDKPERALILSGSNGFKHLFALIADRSTDNRQELIDETLFAAAQMGNESAVTLLLDAGADANYCTHFDGNYSNVLNTAVSLGYPRVVQALLNAGADVNYEHEVSTTPLLAAVRSRCLAKTAPMLLEAGADVNYQHEKYGTALLVASQSGHVKTVSILLKAGAHVNYEHETHGTAFLGAWRNRYLEISVLLFDAGANLGAPERLFESVLKPGFRDGDMSMIELLIKWGVNIDCRMDRRDHTPLMVSVLYANTRVSKLLVESGADYNLMDKYGRTTVDLLKLCGTDQQLLRSICNEPDSPVGRNIPQLCSRVARLASTETWRTSPCLKEMGDCLAILGDLENASIAYELAYALCMGYSERWAQSPSCLEDGDRRSHPTCYLCLACLDRRLGFNGESPRRRMCNHKALLMIRLGRPRDFNPDEWWSKIAEEVSEANMLGIEL